MIKTTVTLGGNQKPVPMILDKFVISISGEHSALIKNVRVSVKDGLKWDWDLPLTLSTYWFYQLKTY